MSVRSAIHARILHTPTSLFFIVPLCILVLATVSAVRHFAQRRGLRGQEVYQIPGHRGSLGILDESGTRARGRERLLLCVYLSILTLLGAMLPLFDWRIHTADGSKFSTKGETTLRAILGFLLGVPVFYFTSAACSKFSTLEGGAAIYHKYDSKRRRVYTGVLALILASATILAIIQAFLLRTSGTPSSSTANHTAQDEVTIMLPVYLPSVLFLLFTLCTLPHMVAATMHATQKKPYKSVYGFPSSGTLNGKSSGGSTAEGFCVPYQLARTGKNGKKASSWRASFCLRPITIHVATHRTSSAEDDKYLSTRYPTSAIPVSLPLGGGVTHCYGGSGLAGADPETCADLDFKRPVDVKTRSLRSSASISTIGSVAEHEWMSMSKRPFSDSAAARSMVPPKSGGGIPIPEVVRTGPAESCNVLERSIPRNIWADSCADDQISRGSGVDLDSRSREHVYPPGFESCGQDTRARSFPTPLQDWAQKNGQYHTNQVQNLVNSAIQVHPIQDAADESISTDNSNSNGVDVCGSGNTRGAEDTPPRGWHTHRQQTHRTNLANLWVALLISSAQLSLACAYTCGCILGVRDARASEVQNSSNALEIAQTTFNVLGAVGTVIACFVHTRSCRTSTTSTTNSGIFPSRQPRSWGFGFCIPSTPNFVKRRSSDTHNLSTMMSSMNTALPSSFPPSAIRVPSTPAYAAAYSINYGSQFHTPTAPIYNQNGDHLYTSIFQHTAQPVAVYDPTASETKSGILESGSPRGRRSRVNAIPPGVVAPNVGLEVPQSCHGDSSCNSVSDEAAGTSVEASREASEVDHFVRSDYVKLSSRPATRRSFQLLRSVSAGRGMVTERRGGIHRSRTTGSNKFSDNAPSHTRKQGPAPAVSNRLFGWERGWETAKVWSTKMGGGTRGVDECEASFLDLKGRTGLGRGQGETTESLRKTLSMAPSAFSYGISSQVVGGSNEGVPGAPRKLKKRPKSTSESTTGATVNTSSHHRLSGSTFISTATTATGATKASTQPSSPTSPSSPSYRRYSLSRGLLGHRRHQSVSSGTGATDNRRHSGLSDSSRIALKRSLTNFRRSVGRTLGPGLTLAVAPSGSRNKVQDGEDGPPSTVSAALLCKASPVSEASTPTPTRESSITPRPARPAIITIQAPTPPSTTPHPFFDPSLQHKTSSSTFRSKERETVVEVEDDAFELEREMEDEIQEMRSECGSSNNHRALERFNATLNSVAPSSSETLYARFREDEEKPWGACVPQTRNALSSPPVLKSDWMRGSSRDSFFLEGPSAQPIPSKCSNPPPSISTLPDVFLESNHPRYSPSTPRHGATLRLSSITMGSVRSAFAGVGARMSSATSRMSVTSAAGASMRNGQRAGTGEGTDDDGDFMDLRDPFASPPPASGKVKAQSTPKNSNLFAPSDSKFGDHFLSTKEGEVEDRDPAGSRTETVIVGGDRRKMTAWGRLPMPARQISAATSKRSSYTSTSKSSRATGKTSIGGRKQKKESKERRTRKTSALSTSSRTTAGGAGSRGDAGDVDFGLEEALLSQKLLSRLDAIAWES